MERFETFTICIGQIYRCIQKIKHNEMTELGLRGTHVMCLYFLGRHPEGLTASELARICDEDRAAISRSVSELETRGYLFCETESGHKKYRSHLFLTELGNKAAELIYPKIDHALDLGGEGLNEQERSVFYSSLSLISSNLMNFCTEKKRRQASEEDMGEQE